MMVLLREAGAVVAGFLAMALAVAASLAMASAVAGVHGSGPPPTSYLGIAVILSGVSGVVGGAVSAWLAGRSHPRTTPVLAVIVGALGVFAALNPQPGQPVWFCWAVTALGVTGVLFGALFWTRARARR